jgi:dipeptidyl aminopeptidase/acylaminoacyl peptidase
MKIVLGAALVLIGVILAIMVTIAVRNYRGERSDFVRWPRSAMAQHPEQAGVPGLREVFFPGPVGWRLAAWYVPPRNRAAIVLAHGTGSDRGSLLPEIRLLAAAGFGVLALDFPGQGASEGQTLWGVGERQSISAAVDWLTTRQEVDQQRIGAFGASMGGYIVVQAAVLDPRLRAVALGAAPSDVYEQTRITSNQWGVLSSQPSLWALRASGMPYADMRPKDVIAKIAPRPVFIIGGELDTTVPPFMARELYQAAREPKELWIVGGAHHVDYASVAPGEYRNRLTSFFQRTLLSAP